MLALLSIAKLFGQALHSIKLISFKVLKINQASTFHFILCIAKFELEF